MTAIMANTSIPLLPPVIALSGAEQFEVVQAGSSSRATLSQVLSYIQQYVSGGTGGSSVLGPQTISPGTTAAFTYQISAVAYGTVRIQIDAPFSDTITFSSSLLSSEAGPSVPAFDDNGGEYQSGITAAGLYSVKGHGYITVTKTGTNSAPTVTFLAYT